MSQNEFNVQVLIFMNNQNCFLEKCVIALISCPECHTSESTTVVSDSTRHLHDGMPFFFFFFHFYLPPLIFETL